MFDEAKYLNLLEKILNEGFEKNDRTDTGTLSVFGERLEFNISNRVVPLMTTKKVPWKLVVNELLWFLSGDPSIKSLQKQGVHFWDANTSRTFLDNKGLTHFEEGELGAGYGFQWRHFGEEYKGPLHNYKGIDQINQAIQLLKTDPDSRRIVVTAWNPSDMDKVALPPCHSFFQFYTVEINGERYLDCMLYQRSADMFLGVPFNIASYSILTHMVAHLVGMKARKFIHVLGDAHIYKNHVDAVRTQLSRDMYDFPTLSFNKNVENIDDFKIDDFVLNNYKCHSTISASMAI